MIIKCPYCGAEYISSEIFMSEDFLEHMSSIDRNKEGKIIHMSGRAADLREEYVCDYCNKSFIALAKIEYETIKNEFEDEYVVSLN